MIDSNSKMKEELLSEFNRHPENAENAFRLSMITDNDMEIPTSTVYVIQAIKNDKSGTRMFKYFDEYMTKMHNQFLRIVYKKPLSYGLNNKYVNMLVENGLRWGKSNFKRQIDEFSLSIQLHSYYRKVYSVVLDDGFDVDIKGIKLPEYENSINELWTSLVKDSFYNIIYAANIDINRCNFDYKKSSDERVEIINRLYMDFGLVARLIYAMDYDD